MTQSSAPPKMNTGATTTALNWWGEFKVITGDTHRWRVGPTQIWVQRLQGEWRLAVERDTHPEDDRSEVAVPCPAPCNLLSKHEVQRFAHGATDAASETSEGRLYISPRLADRAVISRPEQPVTLPPGESAKLYVPTPLWMQLDAGVPGKRLTTIPIFQPSDTWFGASTREGDLCYAARSFFRIDIKRLPRRPHRATTGVTLQNHTSQPLSIKHLNLPTVNLNLYSRDDGSLWTDDIVFARTATGDFVDLSADPLSWRRPPENSKLITPAQEEPTTNLVFRAFSSLFQ